MSASTSVIITAAATAASLTLATTATPTETFPLDPIVVLIDVVDELSGDLFGKKNRAAVIEVNTVFPSVARQDADHRIATIQAAANLTALLLGEGQVNVRTTHTL